MQGVCGMYGYIVTKLGDQGKSSFEASGFMFFWQRSSLAYLASEGLGERVPSLVCEGAANLTEPPEEFVRPLIIMLCYRANAVVEEVVEVAAAVVSAVVVVVKGAAALQPHQTRQNLVSVGNDL